MNAEPGLPRVLIVDDLFGRTHPDRRNEERANLCAQYLLQDVTDDEIDKTGGQRIKRPVGQVVFFRGQSPPCSTVGNMVENDLDATLRVVGDGWDFTPSGKPVWSMVLLDLCFYTGRVTTASNRKCRGMPEGNTDDDNPLRYFGLTILQALHEQFPELPVIILSSKPRESVSKEFSTRGALAFLDRSSAEAPDLFKEYLWRHGLTPDFTGQIVGRSKSLLLALRNARQAARDRRNVLVRGPRGTGKELIARYIHHQGEDPKSPLIIVDSGTLSQQLYASELFGHKRGAFTGADQDRVGRIVQARGGDLFLDEIGNMSPEVQLGLLRAIEHHEVTPVGGNASEPVDARFISATNGDIEEKAATGIGFRLDLLDRLRECGTIILPPLADRKEDIPALIEHYVREAEKTLPNAFLRDIETSTFDKALNYDWPGNVRELKNCIVSAVTRNPDVEHLVPVHLQLAAAEKVRPAKTPLAEPEARIETMSPPRQGLLDLKGLLERLSAFDFETLKRGQLAGMLPELQRVNARFVAQYLKAVLAATTKPIEGRVQIHPAIKMATGNPHLSASKAADIIKGLLKSSEDLDDPILRDAYDIAIRLRPPQQKR